MWGKLITAGKPDHSTGFSPGIPFQMKQELPLVVKKGSFSHFKNVFLY